MTHLAWLKKELFLQQLHVRFEIKSFFNSKTVLEYKAMFIVKKYSKLLFPSYYQKFILVYHMNPKSASVIHGLFGRLYTHEFFKKWYS